jgi:beta-glucosidase
MSYTSFEYSNLKMNLDTVNAKDTLVISFDLKNTGKMKGKEVVQLYLSDLYASITPSVKRLKRFKKIEMIVGDTKRLDFKLSKKDFEFISANNESISEPGEFEISIGNLKKKFYLKN